MNDLKDFPPSFKNAHLVGNWTYNVQLSDLCSEGKQKSLRNAQFNLKIAQIP